jgi:hypothetical protein
MVRIQQRAAVGSGLSRRPQRDGNGETPMRRSPIMPARAGFTLVETRVCCFIIARLLGLLSASDWFQRWQWILRPAEGSERPQRGPVAAPWPALTGPLR